MGVANARTCGTSNISTFTRWPLVTTKRSIALILSPVGLLLISAGRLIIVANFNTTTAVTIASSGGFVNTLLGSIIPMVPVFIPYVALLLLLFRRFLLSILTFAFAAFISPTSITLAEGGALAKADWSQLLSHIASYRTAAILVGLVILAAVWAYNRSFAEGASIVAWMVVALTILMAVPIINLSMPLRLASSNERRIVLQASAGIYGFSGRDILVVAAVVAIVFVALTFRNAVDGLSWLLIGGVALVASIALFPYVHSIYPVPRDRNYYAEATHAMWLPAERIVLNSNEIYYGYVLSSDSDWFTVLLANSRTIAYVPAADVVARSVCQPRMLAQPKAYRPLIPWLYHSPSHLPACPASDRSVLQREPLGPADQGRRQQGEKPVAISRQPALSADRARTDLHMQHPRVRRADVVGAGRGPMAVLGRGYRAPGLHNKRGGTRPRGHRHWDGAAGAQQPADLRREGVGRPGGRGGVHGRQPHDD
jgi:hypothetical protein